MQHFGPQCPSLVTFGAMGITCRAVCSASWVLLCAVGTVLGGCRWCVTIAIVAGVGHSLLVLADCIHSSGAVGDLFPGMLSGKVVHCDVSQLNGGCLEWLCHRFPKELPSWQYTWMIWQCRSCLRCSSLIILQQSISVLMHAMKSWGSSPDLATISSSSPRHTWVLMSCVIPCWIWSRKAEAFTLVAVCSSLLLVGINCVCVSRDLVPRAAKMYLWWSSLSGGMWLRRSQFSRVCQNMEKEW